MSEMPESSKQFKNHIFSWRIIREFLENHPEHRAAEPAFDRWFKLARQTKFNNFSDVRKLFPAADQVGSLIVFDLGGNKFRVIAAVRYHKARIYIQHVLTHEEYLKNKWKQ